MYLQVSQKKFSYEREKSYLTLSLTVDMALTVDERDMFEETELLKFLSFCFVFQK